MKKLFKLTPAIPLCLCVGLTLSAQATITAQWNFKAGTYNPSTYPIIDQVLGPSAMYPLDTPTTLGTTFGSTTAFGISPIGGVATNVMSFPKFADQYGGYYTPVSASANGGGGSVNQYTVIMDVLFPNTPAAGKTYTLFVTDTAYTGGTGGGEFYVTSSGAVGYSGGSGGSLTPNQWHRIAIAVDLTTGGKGVSIGIDGTIVVAGASPPSAVDGSFSIAGNIYLFNDANTNSGAGYIASLQFNDQRLDDGFITGLGAAVASGVPAQLTSPYVVSAVPQNDLRFPGRSAISPTPLIEIILNNGINTVSNSTIVLKLNGSTVPATVTYSAPTTTISYQVPKANALVAGSRNTVALTYQDSAANPLSVQWQFDVGQFVVLPGTAVLPSGSANTPGFIYRIAQAPASATLDNSLTRALQQLDGTLLDTNGLPYVNEADLTQTGSQGGGTYFVDLYEGTSGTIAFSTGGRVPWRTPRFYRLPVSRLARHE